MWFLAKLIKDTRAATSVEYAVMLALILLVAFAAVGLVGSESSTMWGNVASSIESAEQ
ncbi:MAG: Flp family type IVb pilin [Pirellulales bacterium]|nr:Flp family type IVb pilin [Pirellulales bacterium]